MRIIFKNVYFFLEIDGQSIETSSFIQESIVLSKEVCTKNISQLEDEYISFIYF